MSTSGFQKIITANVADRSDLFLATANRLGAPLINIEKDFWVCWTLNALYHRLPEGGPRLLFKGGTSLSKAYGLINRFSEDIDVTVFRDDLGHAATPEALAALSGKKRKAAIEAIQSDCQAYITGPLLEALTQLIAEDTKGKGRIETDPDDGTGQTLLVWYPRVDESDTGYVQAAVKIESGAKSALDPNSPRLIQPYISDDLDGIDLDVPDVRTVDAERTFWDKVVILHGLRNWFDIRRRHLAVNDVLPFRQHLAARAFDVVGDRHKAQHSRAPLLDRHTLNLRPAAHQLADANIIVEGKLPARPHPARQGHRRQKITPCRMSVGPELRSRNCGLRKT